PDLKFYYDTKFRKLTRYKMRARFYGRQATDVIWPEIKYRNASVIWKKRSSVPLERWPTLFHPEYSERREPVIKAQMDSFEELIYWHNAQPTLHVRYFREPYVTELEEYGRVTFDRQLCCRPTNGSIELAYHEEDMIYYDDPIDARCDDSPVILEIKVESLVPIWAIELIRKFHLQQRGFSKYGTGIDSVFGQQESLRNSMFY
ncbi:VTC domain-containing protein, partial [candidate division KSB1 bacterium]